MNIDATKFFQIILFLIVFGVMLNGCTSKKTIQPSLTVRARTAWMVRGLPLNFVLNFVTRPFRAFA